MKSVSPHAGIPLRFIPAYGYHEQHILLVMQEVYFVVVSAWSRYKGQCCP